MKTSNKILIGLLVVIFTVPFLLASSLKGKIKRGEYTVEQDAYIKSRGSLHTGSFTAFKVVKVVSPRPGLLTCHLKASDSTSYSYYNNNSTDSIMVYTSNDTLYIKYTGANAVKAEDMQDNFMSLRIQVNLPAFNNLVVDGASVVIDSLAGEQSNLSVTLKNKGSVKDGGKNKKRETVKAVQTNDIKRDNITQAIVPTKPSVTKEKNKLKLETVQKVGLDILDWNMKDVLIYRLENNI